GGAVRIFGRIGARGRTNSARERRTEPCRTHGGGEGAARRIAQVARTTPGATDARCHRVNFESRRGTTRTARRAGGRNYGAREPALPRGRGSCTPHCRTVTRDRAEHW